MLWINHRGRSRRLRKVTASADGSLSGAPGSSLKDLLKAAREYEPLVSLTYTFHTNNIFLLTFYLFFRIFKKIYISDPNSSGGLSPPQVWVYYL